MEKKRNGYSVLVGNPKEKDHLQDLATDGSIRLTLNLLPENAISFPRMLI